MHCLFLSIAKWIVKRIWIDEKVLKPKSLKEIQRKMNQFQVPADIGRIPGKVKDSRLYGRSMTNIFYRLCYCGTLETSS
jgi:hypothetical protein